MRANTTPSRGYGSSDSPENRSCKGSNLNRQVAHFDVPALDCPAELRQLEQALTHFPAHVVLRPDFAARRLQVEFDAGAATNSQIAEALRATGFEVRPALAHSRASKVSVQTASLAAALCAWLVGAACFLAGWSQAADGLAIGVVALAGWPVFLGALAALRRPALDIQVLMLIAVSGALALGEYFEAAASLVLFGVAHWIERATLVRMQRAVERLAAGVPPTAHRLIGGETEDVPAAALSPGEQIVVRPGERVPVDGRVLQGASAVNETVLTGESAPQEKEPGDEVLAGSLNGDGSLTLLVLRPADASTVAQIARQVEQARATRSPTERRIDRFARYYTPGVVAMALCVAVVPPWWAGAPLADYSDWFRRALVLLVVACPCALVISTPLTMTAGLLHAARRGLLIKGADALETAAGLRTIALDKTGTLTNGAPKVRRISCATGRSDDEALRIAASLAAHSEHPLATAMREAAAERNLAPQPVEQFATVRGRGMFGTLAGQRVWAGSPAFAEEHCQDSTAKLLHDLLADLPLDGEGHTLVVVGASEPIGVLELGDELRPESPDALARLRRSGILHFVMLTGDRRSAALGLAHTLGIDDVRAELLPQEKVAAVAALAEEDQRVAMVGDGVNDAPALAAAPLGIALGHAASATTLEAAQVAAVSGSLLAVAELVELAQRVQRILRENIAWSLIAKSAVLLAGALGWASLWMAVGADVGASLIVALNSLRVLGRSRDT